MPDYETIGTVVAIAMAGLLCGCVALLLAVLRTRGRAARNLAVAAIVVGLVAAASGVLFAWGGLAPWCYAVPAFPILPGAAALMMIRATPHPRGFPITATGARPSD